MEKQDPGRTTCILVVNKYDGLQSLMWGTRLLMNYCLVRCFKVNLLDVRTYMVCEIKNILQGLHFFLWCSTLFDLHYATWLYVNWCRSQASALRRLQQGEENANSIGLAWLSQLGKGIVSHQNLPVEPQSAQSEWREHDYVSSRKPPPGWKKWLTFAKDNKCHMGSYNRIEKDLQVTSTLDWKSYFILISINHDISNSET